MFKFLLIILFISASTEIRAQDSLDSIARVKASIPLDEIELMVKLSGGNINNFKNSYSSKVEKLAKTGNAAAQNHLGECYLLGNGIAKNNQEAFYWISKSAEQNNIRALHNLGYCYEHGIGTDIDLFQAYSYYKISALKGNDKAFNDLAQCYLNGIGTTVDSLKARAWFEKGAEVGIRASQNNAGYLYIAIEGKEDYNKAFYWFSKAAEQDSPNALEFLGICYDNGWGVEKDPLKAQEYYKKAYRLGNRDAKERIK